MRKIKPQRRSGTKASSPKQGGDVSLGAEIVGALNELHQALQAGEDLAKRFTVRQVKLDLDPGEYDARAVRMTRRKLGVSQALFAKLMAVSVDLVQSWEQGVRLPKPIACRLLDEINHDPGRWRSRLVAA